MPTIYPGPRIRIGDTPVIRNRSVLYGDAGKVVDELEARGVIELTPRIVDDDNGATVAGTTSPTTLLASSPIVMPIPAAGDVFHLALSGSWLNLSGGALTDTITCQWNGNNLWTPAAFSIANLGISSFSIDAWIRCPTAGATGQTVVASARFRVNTVGAQTLDATASKEVSQQFVSQNTSVATNITCTATHSGNSASFSTFGYGGFLERLRKTA